VISESGARDLLDAYDLIAETRLRHQAARIRAGRSPDNFMAPADLSDLERNHLRDAFMVVKTMQSAIAQSRGAPG
jgi:CBS domain-containing protein